ncbi:hypothetical protein TSOC_000865 [Tetrabaena socialis]|uniref:BTB domain-containing protein n=1 Tax=Tetrabaena socialis TaxID=47790 RepID=A0A2J8AIC3_9CHLO|nr:hypothetical protein TSOC_000865 [Tetrabaena socialis]|eukprot:PNH12262.1 hypothetical protein TSOC_000865 [Tetrabaena socialis]
MLGDLGDGCPAELLVEDEPEEWRDLLPLIYPRMSTPRLTWMMVRRVLRLAHKFDIPLVLKACESFLASMPLSASKADPNYVLHWLQVSERLHLDHLTNRAIHYFHHGDAVRPPHVCDYCGCSSSSSRGSFTDAAVGPQHQQQCSCACAVCSGSRMLCACGTSVRGTGAVSSRPPTPPHHRYTAREPGLQATGGGGSGVGAVAVAMLNRQRRYHVPLSVLGAEAQAASMARTQPRSDPDLPLVVGGYSTPPRYGTPYSGSAGVAVGGGAVKVRDVVLRDRGGLQRLSVRVLVDMLSPPTPPAAAR